MELKVPISQHFSTGYNFGMKFYTKIKYIGLTWDGFSCNPVTFNLDIYFTINIFYEIYKGLFDSTIWHNLLHMYLVTNIFSNIYII